MAVRKKYLPSSLFHKVRNDSKKTDDNSLIVRMKAFLSFCEQGDQIIGKQISKKAHNAVKSQLRNNNSQTKV